MLRYGQFCAVARALEVLGERWTLLVVRELLLGSTTFTELQRGLPRIPRATLAARLRSLTSAGIVRAGDRGYGLTEAGWRLAPVVRELAVWAMSADAAALTADHLDLEALSWDIHRRVDHAALPARMVVVEIELTDRPATDRRFWLHLSRKHVDLCRAATGAPVDVWLSTPTEPLTRWWLGELRWRDVIRRRDVRLHGDRRLRGELPRWFQRYVYAPDVLAAAG